MLASIVGIFSVRATDKDKSAMAPINRGFLVASVLTVIGTGVVALLYVGNETDANEGWRVFGAVVIGLVLAQVVSRLTEYYTSTETAPVRDIAEAARTGPATTVLSGIASGLESTVFAIIAIALRSAPPSASATATSSSPSTSWPSPAWACWPPPAWSWPRTPSARSPTTPPASPRCPASSSGEPERIMVSLDAVGNTTKAVTKGFAIGSAVIASVALFASYIETIADETLAALQLEELEAAGTSVFDALPDQRRRPEDLHRPAHRWLGRLPVQLPRHPCRRPHRRHGGRGGPAPVP